MLLLDLEHEDLSLRLDLDFLSLPAVHHPMHLLHVLPRVALYVLLNTDKTIEICLVTICCRVQKGDAQGCNFW
jgi:hypothetical protein